MRKGDVKMDKICPILAIAGNLDKEGHSPCQCQKEKCQLWVEVWVDIKREWRCGLIKI